MSASVTEKEMGYLHTSPEYAMKRLLAAGLGDIFFLGHVYRKGEIGSLHNPEFTMVEWYRLGASYLSFIQETCELMQLFLGKLPIRIISYREVFQTYAGFDPFTDFPSPNALGWDRDTQLHYYYSHLIEKNLGIGELTVLSDYPPSQAALAKVIEKDGIRVAERFEIYHRGVELSNGYHELTDAKEQRRRFEAENNLRESQGKHPYSLDENFLQALELGMPDCCGVSVGFDRLMLLRHQCQRIRDVMPFAWDEV
jgi:lysyl-tRNA synthetase class 2